MHEGLHLPADALPISHLVFLGINRFGIGDKVARMVVEYDAVAPQQCTLTRTAVPAIRQTNRAQSRQPWEDLMRKSLTHLPAACVLDLTTVTLS